jgi:multidrug efflux pump subunit AcrB
MNAAFSVVMLLLVLIIFFESLRKSFAILTSMFVKNPVKVEG